MYTMKIKFLLLSALLLTFVGCDHREKPKSQNDQVTEDMDNTGRNIRDRDFNTITPGNQSESEVDRTLTQAIRKALMADNSLSTNAKNIKVVSINGNVTLRGVVESNQERELITKLVNSVKGIKRVDNQLEVNK